jgi:Ribose 5-phosphate isomerase
LLREKILSSYSKTYIIIVDYTKYSKIIGEKASVCIEVIPFAATPVLKRIKKMCEKAHIRYGERLKDGPIVTDNHNYIIDAYFGKIENPENLSNEINKISGVVENGIFLENISKIIVGYEKDVKII